MAKKTTNLSIKMDPGTKDSLMESAKLRGMDLSKLTRAILTNWVKPGTYSL